jgi:hypothetical protein
MKYYFVREYQYFVDPHGTPDEGGTKKFISQNPLFGFIDNDEDLYYPKIDQVDYLWDTRSIEKQEKYMKGLGTEEEDLQSPEDGYNMEYYCYYVQEITEEQVGEYQEIIDRYNKL